MLILQSLQNILFPSLGDILPCSALSFLDQIALFSHFLS
jgi:hypothetical protein